MAAQFNLSAARPFDEFVKGPYDLPHSADHVRERIERNVGKFQTNYTILILGGLLVFGLMNPLLLCVMLVLIACYLAASHVDDEGTPWQVLQVAGHVFTTAEKQQLLLGVSVAVVLLSGSLSALLWGALAPLSICVVHASWKQTTLISKAKAGVNASLDKAEAKLEKGADVVKKRVQSLFSASK